MKEQSRHICLIVNIVSRDLSPSTGHRLNNSYLTNDRTLMWNTWATSLRAIVQNIQLQSFTAFLLYVNTLHESAHVASNENNPSKLKGFIWCLKTAAMLKKASVGHFILFTFTNTKIETVQVTEIKSLCFWNDFICLLVILCSCKALWIALCTNRALQINLPCLSPNGSWDRLQPPHNPELNLAGIENGWMSKFNRRNEEMMQAFWQVWQASGIALSSRSAGFLRHCSVRTPAT